jgi:hypothetical protein
MRSQYRNVVLRGHALNKGDRWDKGGGKGRVRGVQFIANQGQEWTGTRATARRDFQVSKGEIPNKGGRDFQVTKGVAERGVGMRLYMYIVLIKDCV